MFGDVWLSRLGTLREWRPGMLLSAPTVPGTPPQRLTSRGVSSAGGDPAFVHTGLYHVVSMVLKCWVGHL